MDDIDKIKSRIKNRKNVVLTEYHFNKFYNFMIKTMIVIVLFVSAITVFKSGPNYKKINTFLNQVISNVNIDKYLQELNNKDVEVVQEVAYTHIEGNYYTNNSNECISLNQGIVTEYGQSDILGHYITVLNDDVKVTYGCLDEVFVSQYDEITQSMILGTYSDKVMIIFSKGDKEIDYSTFEELSN